MKLSIYKNTSCPYVQIWSWFTFLSWLARWIMKSSLFRLLSIYCPHQPWKVYKTFPGIYRPFFTNHCHTTCKIQLHPPNLSAPLSFLIYYHFLESENIFFFDLFFSYAREFETHNSSEYATYMSVFSVFSNLLHICLICVIVWPKRINPVYVIWRPCVTP